MQTLAEQWRKRDREREALVKKKVGLLIQQTDAHSTFNSVQIRVPFFWCPTLNLFVLTGGRV